MNEQNQEEKDRLLICGVGSSAGNEDENYYDDEYYESQPHEDCPKCGRTYDDIDFDYQTCSKCGWDSEYEKFGESREPDEDDFMKGDADLLSGHWH